VTRSLRVSQSARYGRAEVKVFQIYFEDGQAAALDYIPYRNDDCTVYFENSVIKNLVESGAHEGSDYFGVVSHKLRSKLGVTRTFWRGTPIGNVSSRTFTPEDFEAELSRTQPDAMGFQQHPPHDPVTLANQFHPNFSDHFARIMAAIGCGWKPTVFKDVFYFNYLVARPSIYQRYVREMLAPAMAVMDQMPDRLAARFGVPHYPYHSFLCERFFSYFVHLNNLTCGHY
jgi:hypothetical protein